MIGSLPGSGDFYESRRAAEYDATEAQQGNQAVSPLLQCTSPAEMSPRRASFDASLMAAVQTRSSSEQKERLTSPRRVPSGGSGTDESKITGRRSETMPQTSSGDRFQKRDPGSAISIRRRSEPATVSQDWGQPHSGHERVRSETE